MITCPTCGADNQPEDRFCFNCGTRLSPQDSVGSGIDQRAAPAGDGNDRDQSWSQFDQRRQPDQHPTSLWSVPPDQGNRPGGLYGDQPQSGRGQPPPGYPPQGGPPPWANQPNPYDATPPPKKRRSPFLTAIFVIIGLCLLACVGTFIYAMTPPGQEFFENLGTQVSELATETAATQQAR